MLPLGTAAPQFTLTDAVSGKTLSLSELKSDKATVVMFICNHCPYVKHVNPELMRVARDYQPRGAAFVAISSNDAERYPDDGPAQMKRVAAQLGYPFPYLYDQTQSVARDYRAACTPDLYLFDGALKLVYRGRLDGSSPGNKVPLTGADLRAALDAVLAGRAPDAQQLPSMGCNIKWATPSA
jgi:thiol-disulfide isomerase/thioredoxin